MYMCIYADTQTHIFKDKIKSFCTHIYTPFVFCIQIDLPSPSISHFVLLDSLETQDRKGTFPSSKM